MLEHYKASLVMLHTNIDRERWHDQPGYRAPHKPLLLLAVIDQLAQGTIKANSIRLSADLVEAFEHLWMLCVGQERTANLAYPFYHLKKEGFWKLVPMPGKEEILLKAPSISSIAELKVLVQEAKLDEPLYELLLNKENREELRKVLLEKYFTDDVRNKHMSIIPRSSALQNTEEDTTPQVNSPVPAELARSQAFISYSHKDARYLAELQAHLAIHARNGELIFWDNTKISPGSHWREETRKALASTKVAILLVSPRFRSSILPENGILIL